MPFEATHYPPSDIRTMRPERGACEVQKLQVSVIPLDRVREI